MEQTTTRLERLQTLAIFVSSVLFAIGMLFSIDVFVIPTPPQIVSWVLLPLLLAVGYWCGLMSMNRRQEIESWRWGIAADKALTSGERDHAHAEAARLTKWATIVWFLAAVGFGVFFATSLRNPAAITPADFFGVVPALGFAIALFIVGRKIDREPPPEF